MLCALSDKVYQTNEIQDDKNVQEPDTLGKVVVCAMRSCLF